MNQVLNVKEGVFLLKYLTDGTLALIDQRSTLRIIDPKTFKVIGGFKTKLEHKHRILNIVDVSSSGKYTLVGLPNKNKAALFLTQEKKLKSMIGHHKGDVETVAISDDESYLATGGTDGHTFVYHANSNNPFIALTPRGDYISCISFSDDSNIVAYGCFDATITVKNIALMREDFVLKGHHAPIKQLHFLSSQFLLAVDREGNVVIWDLHTRSVKSRLPKMLEEILAITVSEDKHFLFVSTIYGNIGLYDLEKFERVTATYLKAQDRVNALALDHKNKVLFCATQEGDLFEHDLLSGDDILLESIKAKDFKKAYKQIEVNVLLRFSDHFTTLEEIWNKSLSQAKQLFAKGLDKTAVQLLEPFSEVPGKRGIINKIVQEFGEFQKFTTYVKEKRYALAYPLAIKFPTYQETQEYMTMEKIWETQFSKAKKFIMDRSGEEKAREHLALFRGVSHKAKLITDLYNQRKVFILFLNKLSKKEYFTVFKLVESYPFLTELKEFKDLKRWGDAIYIKIQQAFQSQDYLSAIKFAKHIKDFPDFKDEIEALVEHSQVYISFKHAIEVQDLKTVYELLENNSFLAKLPALDGIDYQWDDILSKIDEPMSEGNMQEVLYLLKPYPYVAYKKRHIMVFIKTTFMRQLEKAIEDKEEADLIIEGFKNMYATFGKDELLMLLAKNYEKKHNVSIDFSYTKPGNFLTFSIDTLPMSILHT